MPLERIKRVIDGLAARLGGGDGSPDPGAAPPPAGNVDEDFSQRDVGSTEHACPIEERHTLVLIPRQDGNIFDDDNTVRTLLPARYPPEGHPVKDIELNFYPDLNHTRTVTAIVTEQTWSPGSQPRPEPRPGITVYFTLGPHTTADVSLSAGEATTDADGCASVEITLDTLHTAREDLEAFGHIELIASLEPASATAAEVSLVMAVHRNEDVAHPSMSVDMVGERPDELAGFLEPVLSLRTWLVRQRRRFVTSVGAQAVQRLLNQVLLRKRGNNTFLLPDGQYGGDTATALTSLLNDFGDELTGDAEADFRNARFNVAVEQDDEADQGVETYLGAEYGGYEDGQVVDCHLLVGLEPWQRGADANVMDADGLLDIYRAVVWEFLDCMREVAWRHATRPVRWIPFHGHDGWQVYRHGQDPDEEADPPPSPMRPVTAGVAYTLGGAAGDAEFEGHLDDNDPEPDDIERWAQYQRGAWHGEPGSANKYYADWTGIDCSGFIQRVANAAVFRDDHCADLAQQRICDALPVIEDRIDAEPNTAAHNQTRSAPANAWNNKTWTGGLGRANFTATVPGGWNAARALRVVYWMDLLLRQGAGGQIGHVGFLDEDDRHHIVHEGGDQMHILHAYGGTYPWSANQGGAANLEAHLAVIRNRISHEPNPDQYHRRVIRSSLRYFNAFRRYWDGAADANCSYLRLRIWT